MNIYRIPTSAVSVWRQRESDRFTTGQYKPVPVALNYPCDHFVHLSIADGEGDHVTYTPSEAYGKADRQVRLKFGRYLRKTFESLTDAEIQAYVTTLKSVLHIQEQLPTLHFAMDRATINDIFETEMTACGSMMVSCMYGKFNEDDIRPYHVYSDSPDVAVAYVTTSGRIVSRSVVSTKDKIWVRLYATTSGCNDTECGTIKAMLTDAGYSKGDLFGNRLTKLATRKVMLPYIDNSGANVSDDGKYWTVTEDGGDYIADCTDGTETVSGPRCSRCEEREEDCDCSYCDCCDGLYANGCDICRMCEVCGQCTEHERCHCARCSSCEEREEDCTCERCSECSGLTGDCECEEEEEEQEEEAESIEPAIEPEPELTSIQSDPLMMSCQCILYKLTSAWVYLREQAFPDGGSEDTPAMLIIRRAFESIIREDIAA